MFLLMDFANIFGGFLLAAASIVTAVPALKKLYGFLKPFTPLIGGLAIVMGGFFTLTHIVNGPRIFAFEIVGLIVGITLLADFWQRVPIVGEEMKKAASGLGTFRTLIGIAGIIVGILGMFTGNG